MFVNVGRKIKALAKGVFIALAITSAIGAIAAASGIAKFFDGFGAFLSFNIALVVVLAVGVGMSYLTVIAIYAFGELVDNSTIIANHTCGAQTKDATVENHIIKNYWATAEKSNITINENWKCPVCGRENSFKVGTCGCGQQKPN